MRVLIVDDEPLARRGLRRQLERLPGVTVTGECAGAADAERAIAEGSVDLVLLDVQMPGASGFDLIERVGPRAMPPVVFVTAHDRYALHAFEVSALDYLLKPVDPDRLRDAVDRAADRARERGDLAERLERLLARMEAAPTAAAAVADATPDAPRRRAPRLPVEDERGQITFVDHDAIDWVEAAGNHVRVHAGARAWELRDTMQAMRARLGDGFVRVRRSALVNECAITALEPWGKGSWVVRLRSGERVLSSRHFASELRPLLAPRR